jgi:hypothetical protein
MPVAMVHCKSSLYSRAAVYPVQIINVKYQIQKKGGKIIKGTAINFT